MAKLIASLSGKARILIPGSNALIQALVASGAENLAGAISTAKGGPWDLCGVLLVRQAGGTIRGFKKVGEKLVQHNPLDVYGCDSLVMANSEPIANFLEDKMLAL